MHIFCAKITLVWHFGCICVSFGEKKPHTERMQSVRLVELEVERLLDESRCKVTKNSRTSKAFFTFFP